MENTNNDTSGYFLSKLKNFDKPIILELGVNKGGSTFNFLKFVNNYGGELYSIDINDCSNIVNNERFKDVDTNSWNFLKTNDLNIEYILEKFPKIKVYFKVLSLKNAI
mgnify:FL=1